MIDEEIKTNDKITLSIDRLNTVIESIIELHHSDYDCIRIITDIKTKKAYIGIPLI